MANIAYHQLFGRRVVTRAISRIKTPQSRFQTFLGMQPDGPNTDFQRGDKFGWDIMDTSRALAPGRPPNQGPANMTPQPVGHVTVSAYRSHGKVEIMENKLYNTRLLGGGDGEIDLRGQRYVTRQERILAQKFRNSREFIISRMLRGSFQLKVSGDDWTPVDSGGHITIDFQIPAGNKSQLDMTGGGDIINTSWATTGSADVPNDLLQINAAFEELHGRPLRHIWCNSTIINHVMNNTKMQNLAGTANRVFQTFSPEGEAVDGIPDTGFRVIFNAVPWVTFHVYDAGLDVDGTFTKFLTDTTAIFMPDPDGDVAEWIEGSEIVRATRNSASFEAIGFTAWTTPDIDPPRLDLKALDIGMGALYIPKAIGYGTVVF